MFFQLLRHYHIFCAIFNKLDQNHNQNCQNCYNISTQSQSKTEIDNTLLLPTLDQVHVCRTQDVVFIAGGCLDQLKALGSLLKTTGMAYTPPDKNYQVMGKNMNKEPVLSIIFKKI